MILSLKFVKYRKFVIHLSGTSFEIKLYKQDEHSLKFREKVAIFLVIISKDCFIQN